MLLKNFSRMDIESSMQRRPRRSRWFILAVLFEIFVPAAALAQASYYVAPAFSFTETYNDNILLTASNRKTDFISRLTPAIVAGYESVPLTLLGGYNFDGEIFAHSTDLNTAMARQNASLDFKYLPTPLFTLALKGDYTETLAPKELNVLSGIAGGRTRANHFLLDPSMAYRFDPLTTGTVGYAFTKDRLSGGVTTDTHVEKIALDRKVTPRDTANIEFTYRQFVFDTDDTVRSYAITPGWRHEITPLTSFMVRAGPRFSDGAAAPEVLASIRHRLKEGDISLAYTRSQATAIGTAGALKTDNVALVAKYRFLPLLEVGATLGFSKNTGSGSEANVYRVKLDSTYEITRWLSLVGSYEYNLQKGILGVRRHDEDISQNIVLFSLVTKFRARVY